MRKREEIKEKRLKEEKETFDLNLSSSLTHQTTLHRADKPKTVAQKPSSSLSTDGCLKFASLKHHQLIEVKEN